MIDANVALPDAKTKTASRAQTHNFTKMTHNVHVLSFSCIAFVIYERVHKTTNAFCVCFQTSFIS